MKNEVETLSVRVGESNSITALLYPASKKSRVGTTVILAHGAGANQLSPFMCLFASGLADRGFDVMTFNFVYMEQRRRAPDPKAKLEACYRAVIEAAYGHKKLKGNNLVIGGKSMGGRIASQVAAADSTGLTGPGIEHESHGIAPLVFLGYPLHPPGKPEQLRDAHLKDVHAPMLFVQGSRDVFGTEKELRSVIRRLHLPATLHLIVGGDHSLKVPKGAGVPQEQVYQDAMDAIARWIQTVQDSILPV